MRTIFLLLSGVLLLICCKEKKHKDPGATVNQTALNKPAELFLLTDSSWGGISAATDRDGLNFLYGDSNIKDERICGPECVDSVDVTIVYPGNNNEFIVYWVDSFYHKKIGLIRCISGEAPYYTDKGIKMGTTLKELLKINGKPISFYGFGWDYGGTVISLNHGILEKTNVRFNLGFSEPDDDNSLSGDMELNPEIPAVKKWLDKITVSELLLPFNY